MSDSITDGGTTLLITGTKLYGLLTDTDFSIVFGAFIGALFVVTMPEQLPIWRRLSHFIISFSGGILGAGVLASITSHMISYTDKPLDALCAVVISVLAVKLLTSLYKHDIATFIRFFSFPTHRR